jgi:hypothetical protein
MNFFYHKFKILQNIPIISYDGTFLFQLFLFVNFFFPPYQRGVGGLS